MFVDQASFYCSWLSISQDLVRRHEMNFCHTNLMFTEGQGTMALDTNTWCPHVMTIFSTSHFPLRPTESDPAGN